MSESPQPRKLRPRPKIQLPVPGQYGHYPQTPVGYVATPGFGQTPIPSTPGSVQPQFMYYNKASEFVFAQFKGIKDFTKSGLSVGEKSAFWLYEKVSSWSRRWFTHIFLVVVVFLYSIAGAFLFIYIEGNHEETVFLSLNKDRHKTIWAIKDSCENELANKSELLYGEIGRQLQEYENQLRVHFKNGFVSSSTKVWSFWNAVFYCGTIYTTIGE